jgi:hypothetical protein
LAFRVGPSDAPGGGNNYGAAGARIDGLNVGGETSPSVVQQIDTYLASSGAPIRTPSYLIRTDDNDLSFIQGKLGGWVDLNYAFYSPPTKPLITK